MASARVESLRLYPVKGFAGADTEAARISDSGTLEHDREFALYDDEVLNGRETEAVYGYTASVTPSGTLAVESPHGEGVVVGFDDEGRRRLEGWLDRNGLDATVLRDDGVGFVDRRDRLASVSVVSTGTVREVASWFDGVDPDGMRRRLRMNVEVSGVEAFWEDGFAGGDAPDLSVGGVRLEGVEPCNRCVVPTRDPDTGEVTNGFREAFIEGRRPTVPDREPFDRDYTVGLICRVADEDRGSSTLRVGDIVEEM
jgi:uncharacterized protein YcbX